jgi:hypothetical protein
MDYGPFGTTIAACVHAPALFQLHAPEPPLFPFRSRICRLF